MNKSLIGKFSTQSRVWLRDKMALRLEQLGITEKGIEKPYSKTEKEVRVSEFGDTIELNKYLELIAYVEGIQNSYEKEWYEELLEESAYTWFNRFIAIKYMEMNNYLPDNVNVLTSSKGKIETDIMDEYQFLSFSDKLDMKYIKEGLQKHKTEEIFRYLFLATCQDLAKSMSFMFEKENDYSELLFPNGVLSKDGIVNMVNTMIPNEDWEEIEIIGWMYQYYNSEKKSQVDAKVKKGGKVSKETLPAKTQLFTPKWIVKYMVENSLGKLLLESTTTDKSIKSNWKYYIDSEEENKVEKKASIELENIKVIDPAMGSGHILVTAFDLLFEGYHSLGYSAKDSVVSILNNNIFGLDIDDRAAQLATFALVMKGREKYRRLFGELEKGEIRLKTLSIKESNALRDETRKEINNKHLKNLEYIINAFIDGKEYGSLIKLKTLNIEELRKELSTLEDYSKSSMFPLEKEDLELLNSLVNQAEILNNKYEIAIANPPYLGGKALGPKTTEFAKKIYPDSKSDLFSMFMEKNIELLEKNGYMAMITMQSWMFLSSYEKLRKELIGKYQISSLVQLGYGAIGIAFGTSAFCLKKEVGQQVKGDYFRMFDKIAQNIQIEDCSNLFKNALKNKSFKYDFNNYTSNDGISGKETSNDNGKIIRYQTNQKEFKKIPGSPIAYWVSERVREIFEKEKKLGDVGDAKVGLQTGDNDRFIRLWNEVNISKIGFGMSNGNEALESGRKWFPYNKGGERRKWYGNQDYVVNWENDGYEIKNFVDGKGKQRSRPQNTNFYFRESISWGLITSSGSSFRYFPNGFVHDVGGMCYFQKEIDKNLLGILNTETYNNFTKIINPTINLQIGDVVSLPAAKINNVDFSNLVTSNISIAREEWDSRETSWDFKGSPLLTGEVDLAHAVSSYCDTWRSKFFTMHRNEEELNRIFIDIYGLGDEMDEKVDLGDITLLKSELKRLSSKDKKKKNEESEEDSDQSSLVFDNNGDLIFDNTTLVKQLLSYIVGCAFGRYSIDKEGLVIANSDDKLDLKDSFILTDKEGNIRHEIKNPRFTPVADGIIPLTETNYYGDNHIVAIVERFLIALFGREKLEENLSYIASNINSGNLSSREVIRNYYATEFLDDHKRYYSSRPIYWEVSGNGTFTSSGKVTDSGFSALIYLHRIDANTFPRLRNNYVNEAQGKITIKLEDLRNRELDLTLTTTEKSLIKKEKEKCAKAQIELIDLDKKLNNLINENIVLDLDDGVKVNYNKIQEKGEILVKLKL